MGRNGSEDREHPFGTADLKYLCGMWTSEHAAARWLAADLAAMGLRYAVVAPGSRNAPLVLAFHHHPQIELAVAVDERAAAHIALGMALRTRVPAAAISTSGTAAVNFGPALAEAFYQGVPLIALTADRPAAAIDRGHGQTVRQSGLFTAHTRYETTLDADLLDESALRARIAEAWRAAADGPVHLNVPFDEPLYGITEVTTASLPATQPSASASPHIAPIAPTDRVLVLLGPAPHTERRRVPESCAFEVIADAFSGWYGVEASADRWMRHRTEPFPDVVITVGGPPMSKALRNAVPDRTRHVHVGAGPWDVWGRLEHVQVEDPMAWLMELAAGRTEQGQAMPLAEVPLEDALSDAAVIAAVGQTAPESASVHIANSTAARYAQLVPWRARRVHANRGVAGIDGCTSTAVGEALAHPDEWVVVVTGDLAFLYDLNGLWVDPEPRNVRVVVVDNGGGGIFRWLKGPKESGLLTRYFEGGDCRSEASGGRRSLEAAAASVGAACQTARSAEGVRAGLDWLFAGGTRDGVKVLVVETDGEASDLAYQRLMDARPNQSETRWL